MYIKVVELCIIDNTVESYNNVGQRSIVYKSGKDTLQGAFNDYVDNWNCDKVVQCYDDFEGEQLEIIKYVSCTEIDF